MQIGSGLTRFKSAPCSYFDTFLYGDDDWEQLLNPRICSPERQMIFARFMSSGDNSPNDNNNNKLKNSPRNVNLQSESQMSSQFLAPKRDDDDIVEPAVKKRKHQLQRQQSHGFCSVVNRNQIAEVKMESRGLVRHSSSPAGLFDGINTEEIGAMRGMGNFGAGNIANPEASFPSPSRFKNKTDLPPRNPPSAKMAPISGFGSKAIGENRPLDARFDCNFPGFPLNQWDGSILSDDFFNELAEDDIKPFMKTHASYDQKSDGENRPTTRLPHHLSLPKSCSAMEKLLQDSVPCKLRAKRGFATHPRSIAERVRRTKISERIRKLQELVPNMDDQTNTAEMLDLAVDYIKDLQRQVKRLSDNGAKCVCSAMKKS